MTHQQEIQARIKAQLDLPCADPTDQAVRDDLAKGDRLHAEGHTLACAVRQVYRKDSCTCHLTQKEPTHV